MVKRKYKKVYPYSVTKQKLADCPDQYWKKIFMGLYYTGSRSSELIDLLKSDIYVDSIDLDFVNIDVTTKKKRADDKEDFRTIMIHKDIEPDAFKLFTSIMGSEDKPAFPPYSPGIADSTFLRTMRKKCNHFFGYYKGRRGTTNKFIATHFWRHSRASHLVAHFGFSSQQLTQYMGWADERMSSTYVHLDKRHLQAAFKKGAGLE